MVSSLINFTISSTQQGINWTEWISAISTFATALATIAMAIFAWKALDSWRYEQKRRKLIDFLEFINKYLYDLQYYEANATIFSKNARKNYQENYENVELIKKQPDIIDTELTEESMEFALFVKNWLIEDNNQEQQLNELRSCFSNYKQEIYKYIDLKVKYYEQKSERATIMYGLDNDLLNKMEKCENSMKRIREEIIERVEAFKSGYKSLIN